MDEATVRRLAHVYSLAADLESCSVKAVAMTTEVNKYKDDLMLLSDRMARIAKALRSLGGVECQTGDANDVERGAQLPLIPSRE